MEGTEKGMDRQEQAEIKECTLTEEAMRCLCRLPSCKTGFAPKRKDQLFCRPEHKDEFYRLARVKGVEAMTAKRPGMHYRTMNSPQMKDLYAALADGDWKTTKELHRLTEIENVSTAISELRRCGYVIKKIFVKVTATRAKVYSYRLIGRAA